MKLRRRECERLRDDIVPLAQLVLGHTAERLFDMLTATGPRRLAAHIAPHGTAHD